MFTIQVASPLGPHSTFQLADYDQSAMTPAEFCKVELTRIAIAFKFDTIYDSITGYPVGSLHVNEMRVMLNQIWASELAAELRGITDVKAFPVTADFAPVIESGIDQLRIRQLATMRPTPALAYTRDEHSIESLRQVDPNRICSILLIKLLADNTMFRDSSRGLMDIIARHEMAIIIGEAMRHAQDSLPLWQANRYLIELEARWGIEKAILSKRDKELLHLIRAGFVDGNPLENTLALVAQLAKRVVILMSEKEYIELGNRAMRPALREKTHEEVMLGIHAESLRMEHVEQLNKQRRENNRQAKSGKTPSGKPKIVISSAMLSAVNLTDILNPKH